MSMLASVLRRYLQVYCPDKKFHYTFKPRASHHGPCVNSIDLGESVTSKKTLGVVPTGDSNSHHPLPIPVRPLRYSCARPYQPGSCSNG